MQPTVQQIEFNTGRKYTPEGQRIMVVTVGTDTCPVTDQPLIVAEFHDQSRHVAGRIIVNTLTERDVMAAYDSGLYSYCKLRTFP